MEEYTKEQKIALYYPLIYKFIYIQLQGNVESQDITQEVFCKYLSSDIKFDNCAKEKAWLFKVASNLCKNYWKTGWHKNNILLDTDIPDLNAELEFAYEKKERRAAIIESITALPRRYREVIYLFYYEDMSVAEISSITGRNKSTVQTQLERGRKLMKKSIETRLKYYIFGITAVIFAALILSSSVYAAYLFQRNIKFTDRGEKIDDFALSGIDGGDSSIIAHNYPNPPDDKSSGETGETGKTVGEAVTLNFDTWDEAVGKVNFPLPYPDIGDIELSSLEYCGDDAVEKVTAVYESEHKEICLSYNHYTGSGGWSFSTDYNGEILKQWTHENVYGYVFSMSKVKYDEFDDFDEIFCMISFEDYWLRFSFIGYDEDYVYAVLDELDLSVYE